MRTPNGYQPKIKKEYNRQTLLIKNKKTDHVLKLLQNLNGWSGSKKMSTPLRNGSRAFGGDVTPPYHWLVFLWLVRFQKKVHPPFETDQGHSAGT